MSKIENIVTDLDGTLLNDQGLISETTEEYLSSLNGIVDVILVSGRSIERITPFAQKLKLQNNKKPYIVGLGGNIVYNLKTKDLIFFKEFDIFEVSEILQNNSFSNKTIYGYTKNKTYIFKDKIDLKQKIKNFLRFLAGKSTFVVEKKKAKRHLLKLQLIIDQNNAPSLPNTINGNIFVNKNEIEILPPGINKMVGLTHLGLLNENSIYFGDSDNDVPCLEHFSKSVSLGNSSSKAIEASKIRLEESNNEDGLVKYLKEENYFEFK